jgi:hypothetical protein
MTSDTLAPRYSKSAERPVRSCPVVCTMISAGIAHASVSHAPGRKPAAVGASGSEEMEKSLYMAMWPVLSEGCMPLTMAVILVPEFAPCTSVRVRVRVRVGVSGRARVRGRTRGWVRVRVRGRVRVGGCGQDTRGRVPGRVAPKGQGQGQGQGQG